MLTKQDLNSCGACMALRAQDHTRLGREHRWLIGDPIYNNHTGEVVSVRSFIDHDDHVVAVHPFKRESPLPWTTL